MSWLEKLRAAFTAPTGLTPIERRLYAWHDLTRRIVCSTLTGHRPVHFEEARLLYRCWCGFLERTYGPGPRKRVGF